MPEGETQLPMPKEQTPRSKIEQKKDKVDWAFLKRSVASKLVAPTVVLSAIVASCSPHGDERITTTPFPTFEPGVDVVTQTPSLPSQTATVENIAPTSTAIPEATTTEVAKAPFEISLSPELALNDPDLPVFRQEVEAVAEKLPFAKNDQVEIEIIPKNMVDVGLYQHDVKAKLEISMAVNERNIPRVLNHEYMHHLTDIPYWQEHAAEKVSELQTLMDQAANDPQAGINSERDPFGTFLSAESAQLRGIPALESGGLKATPLEVKTKAKDYALGLLTFGRYDRNQIIPIDNYLTDAQGDLNTALADPYFSEMPTYQNLSDLLADPKQQAVLENLETKYPLVNFAIKRLQNRAGDVKGGTEASPVGIPLTIAQTKGDVTRNVLKYWVPAAIIDLERNNLETGLTQSQKISIDDFLTNLDNSAKSENLADQAGYGTLRPDVQMPVTKIIDLLQR